MKAAELFSERERQLLRLMVEESLIDKEIAAAMGLKEQSVKNTRHKMYLKVQDFLGCSWTLGMVDLALFAVTHGLVNMRTVIDRYSPVALSSRQPLTA